MADEVDFKPPLTAVHKHVVVIGAGIAGMEAAWTAAARGHTVTVFGSSCEVGGKTRLHASLPNSESLSSIYDFQLVAAQRAGVRFELGVTATANDVLGCGADEVVLATGGSMTWPACLPAELMSEGVVPDLREAMHSLLEHAPQRRNSKLQRQPGCAVVLDLDQTEGTYAAAEMLRERFSRVVLLTPRQGIADEVVLVMRQRILRRFFELGIEVMPLVEPRWSSTFEDQGRLEVASIFGPVVTHIDDVSLFAYASPRAPNDSLRDGLRAAGLPVHKIGDCKVARDVLAATSEGSAIGMSI